MTHVEKIEIEIMIEFTQDEKDKMKKEQAWLQSRSFLVRCFVRLFVIFCFEAMTGRINERNS